jgi:hypothetical protein
MSCLKVFVIALGALAVGANVIPTDKDYSIVNRELLLPDELLIRNAALLENQTAEVTPGLFEGGKSKFHSTSSTF